MSAQHQAQRFRGGADHPSAYAARSGKPARWASNSSRSAMPVRYQQSLSYVRNVGFLPVHRLMSMRAMLAQEDWIAMPFRE